MTSHRRIVLTGLVVAALPAGTPALAAGSSLLSGYGGPGQGSQAILGSALLGGGAGGGGSTSGGSGGSSGSFRYGEQPGKTKSSASGAAGAGVGRKGAGGTSHPRQASAGQTSSGGAGTYPASSAERTGGAGAGQSETLGLSGDDLLYILLALAGLAFTGVLTRQLVRTNGPEKNNC